MPSFFLQYKRTMQEEWRYFFMEYGLISHRAALNECYALDKDHLEIEIKTGYEVTEVLLCFGDPFSAGILGGAEEYAPQYT